MISTPPIVNSSCCDRIRSGMPSCEPPRHSRPMFCRMKEKPTAVISGASLGALRSGRYPDPLDHRVQQAGREHGDRQRDHQADDQQARAGVLRQTDRSEEARRDERADHEDLAVGEVDQLDDAVDERVADGHQRPDGAVGDAVDEVVAEPGEIVRIARQVLDREPHGHREQDDDQTVLRDEVTHRLTRGGGARCGNACGFHVDGTLPERRFRGREVFPTPGCSVFSALTQPVCALIVSSNFSVPPSME